MNGNVMTVYGAIKKNEFYSKFVICKILQNPSKLYSFNQQKIELNDYQD